MSDNLIDKLVPKVTVPEGRSGKWWVNKFTIDKDGAARHNLRERIVERQHGLMARLVRPGDYTRLLRGDETIMSDTDAERGDHYDPVKHADGDCLIMGLGLGVVANAILRKSKHNTVTVVEKDPDVIKLIAPHYRALFGDRLTVTCADAFEFKPPRGKNYNVVWHDIWDNTCVDNLKEMAKLMRRWKSHCEWQGCWGRWECLQQRVMNY